MLFRSASRRANWSGGHSSRGKGAPSRNQALGCTEMLQRTGALLLGRIYAARVKSLSVQSAEQDRDQSDQEYGLVRSLNRLCSTHRYLPCSFLILPLVIRCSLHFTLCTEGCGTDAASSCLRLVCGAYCGGGVSCSVLHLPPLHPPPDDTHTLVPSCLQHLSHLHSAPACAFEYSSHRASTRSVTPPSDSAVHLTVTCTYDSLSGG